MQNKTVAVRVTKPYNSFDAEIPGNIPCNFGIGIIDDEKYKFDRFKTYILGLERPVREFSGRIIAVLKVAATEEVIIITAPDEFRAVNYEIEEFIAFAYPPGSYFLSCLYENSCGAVVYRMISGSPRFLLIKNRRSAHWGFPKGHMEKDETMEQTAVREVMEETGIHIRVIPGFISVSEYKIGKRVEKNVSIFLAATDDVQTKIQKEEVEDYIWLPFRQCLSILKFENDKNILKGAYNFMQENNID